MHFKIKMLKDWEDLGVVFRRNKTYIVKKTEPDGDFYTDGYYLIPKASCVVI